MSATEQMARFIAEARLEDMPELLETLMELDRLSKAKPVVI